MGLVQTTAPTVEPLLLPAVKAQLRISGTDDDTALNAFISAARGRCESFTGRQLESAIWEWTLDGFGGSDRVFFIPKGPLLVVTSIMYWNNATIPVNGIIDSGTWETDATHFPFGRIKPVDGQSWPSDIASNQFETVAITFVAGYSAIPAELIQAMLLMIGHWHNNRENTIEGSLSQIPLAAEDLMTPFKTEWHG